MMALYIERYLNYGMTKEELMSGKPIIGIAQSGSDLAPCNRHHLELVKRVREGIRTAGGIPFEFPTHPIQESSRRPTAAIDRNLSYLGLVEILHGYFLDGVVLLTGCDKTTPAAIMAAATVVCDLCSHFSGAQRFLTPFYRTFPQYVSMSVPCSMVI
jgi:dihydroxy-acid dehydratase